MQLDLEQVKKDLEQAQLELDKLGGLQEAYGYGSENYYSEQCVVVLQRSKSKEVTIYGYLNGTYSARCSASGISWEWSRKWSDHKTQATVTGNTAGFYTVKMTNDQNDDSFEILVIVIE